jgi:hypothetical protein
MWLMEKNPVASARYCFATGYRTIHFVHFVISTHSAKRNLLQPPEAPEK